MTKTKLHKNSTGPFLVPLAYPQVSFMDHWENLRADFRATGVVFDTCRPLFHMPQVSFMDHTYLSHQQNLFVLALEGGFYTRGSKTRHRIRVRHALNHRDRSDFKKPTFSLEVIHDR